MSRYVKHLRTSIDLNTMSEVGLQPASPLAIRRKHKSIVIPTHLAASLQRDINSAPREPALPTIVIDNPTFERDQSFHVGTPTGSTLSSPAPLPHSFFVNASPQTSPHMSPHSDVSLPPLFAPRAPSTPRTPATPHHRNIIQSPNSVMFADVEVQSTIENRYFVDYDMMEEPIGDFATPSQAQDSYSDQLISQIPIDSRVFSNQLSPQLINNGTTHSPSANDTFQQNEPDEFAQLERSPSQHTPAVQSSTPWFSSDTIELLQHQRSELLKQPTASPRRPKRVKPKVTATQEFNLSSGRKQKTAASAVDAHELLQSLMSDTEGKSHSGNINLHSTTIDSGKDRALVLEAWLNDRLGQSVHIKELQAVLTRIQASNMPLEDVEIMNDRRHLKMLNIDRQTLMSFGVTGPVVDRLYRALYVYSSGLFELFGEMAMQLRDKSKRQEVDAGFWKAFIVLMEETRRDDYQTGMAALEAQHLKTMQTARVEFDKAIGFEQSCKERVQAELTDALTLSQQQGAELETLVAQKDKVADEAASMRAAISSAQRDLETLREANEEFAARAVSHSKILAESEKQRFSMDVKLNRMKEQISKLMAQLKLEEAMRETLHRRLDMNEIDTRAAQGECARAVAQAKEAKENLKSIVSIRDELRRRLFEMGDRAEAAEIALDKAQLRCRDFEKVKNELEALKAQHQLVSLDLKGLEHYRQTRDSEQKRYKKMETDFLSETTRYRTRIEQLDKTIISNQAELRRRGDMIKQLEVEQSDSIDEITKLKSQLTAALGDAKALRDRENMNMREVEDARNSVGQLRKEILNGKALLEQEQAAVVDLKSQIKDYVLKLEDQKSQYVKRDREATHQLNVVNDKLALTQTTLDEVRSELSQTAVELEAERVLTAHQQSTIEQMTSQHLTEREQYETEQARVHDLMVDTEKRMMEMQTVQFTKDERHSKLSEDHQNLKIQFAEFRHQTSLDSAALHAKLESEHSAHLNFLSEVRQEHAIEVRTLQHNLDESKNRCTELVAMLANVRAEMHERVTTLTSELNAAQIQSAHLNDALSIVQTDAESAKSELDASKLETAAALHQLQTTDQALVESREQFQACEIELQTAQSTIEQLRAQISELNQQRGEEQAHQQHLLSSLQLEFENSQAALKNANSNLVAYAAAATAARQALVKHEEDVQQASVQIDRLKRQLSGDEPADDIECLSPRKPKVSTFPVASQTEKVETNDFAVQFSGIKPAAASKSSAAVLRASLDLSHIENTIADTGSPMSSPRLAEFQQHQQQHMLQVQQLQSQIQQDQLTVASQQQSISQLQSEVESLDQNYESLRQLSEQQRINQQHEVIVLQTQLKGTVEQIQNLLAHHRDDQQQIEKLQQHIVQLNAEISRLTLSKQLSNRKLQTRAPVESTAPVSPRRRALIPNAPVQIPTPIIPALPVEDVVIRDDYDVAVESDSLADNTAGEVITSPVVVPPIDEISFSSPKVESDYGSRDASPLTLNSPLPVQFDSRVAAQLPRPSVAGSQRSRPPESQSAVSAPIESKPETQLSTQFSPPAEEVNPQTLVSPKINTSPSRRPPFELIPSSSARKVEELAAKFGFRTPPPEQPPAPHSQQQQQLLQRQAPKSVRMQDDRAREKLSTPRLAASRPKPNQQPM